MGQYYYAYFRGDERVRHCTKECPKDQGVLHTGRRSDWLACYIGYSIDKAINETIRIRAYNFITEKYDTVKDEAENQYQSLLKAPFCPEEAPYGATSDINWATGTITCKTSCNSDNELISYNRSIKLPTFNEDGTKKIDGDVGKDANGDGGGEANDGTETNADDDTDTDGDDDGDGDGGNGDGQNNDKKDVEDDLNKEDDSLEKGYIYTICFTSNRCPNVEEQTLYAENKTVGELTTNRCIGTCPVGVGYIAEVPSTSLNTFACNYDFKCPKAAPYVYEYINIVMGTYEYGEHPGNFSSASGKFVAHRNRNYYDEFQEEYEPEEELVYTGDEEGDSEGITKTLATRCYKACSKLNGIIYNLRDLQESDPEKAKRYTTGFCFNSTKRCMDTNHFRRIRSDGLHATITCVSKCEKYDGYILKVNTLKDAYKEIFKGSEVNNKYFPDNPSNICLYGIFNQEQ